MWITRCARPATVASCVTMTVRRWSWRAESRSRSPNPSSSRDCPSARRSRTCGRRARYCIALLLAARELAGCDRPGRPRREEIEHTPRRCVVRSRSERAPARSAPPSTSDQVELLEHSRAPQPERRGVAAPRRPMSLLEEDPPELGRSSARAAAAASLARPLGPRRRRIRLPRERGRRHALRSRSLRRAVRTRDVAKLVDGGCRRGVMLWLLGQSMWRRASAGPETRGAQASDRSGDRPEQREPDRPQHDGKLTGASSAPPSPTTPRHPGQRLNSAGRDPPRRRPSLSVGPIAVTTNAPTE